MIYKRIFVVMLIFLCGCVSREDVIKENVELYSKASSDCVNMGFVKNTQSWQHCMNSIYKPRPMPPGGLIGPIQQLIYGDTRSGSKSNTNPEQTGDARIIKQDAYGPGVHMDQYGRAVTVQPR
jgi:hypothetical protein